MGRLDDLVSIVVPVYNVEAYLATCVDSLLAQTWQQLEVILVDDGSSDRSGGICDGYAAVDRRVRVVHQANSGLSSARNRGIGMARGRWLLFVDSDDWVDHEAVEVLVSEVLGAGADVAIAGLRRVTAVGADCGESLISARQVLVGGEALTALMGSRHTLFVVACGKLFRRTLFEDVEFPLGRLHEDEFVAHRVLGRSRRVVVVDRALYFYRQHPRSIMGSGFSYRRAVDAVDAHEDRLEYLEGLGRVDLLPLAKVQLFRKYMRLSRGLSERPEYLRMRSRMRLLARDVRRDREFSYFAFFAMMYAWFPKLVDPVYVAYGSTVGRLRTGWRRWSSNRRGRGRQGRC